MSMISSEGDGIILPPPPPGSAVFRMLELLEKATEEELADMQARLAVEINIRVEQAEQKLVNMRKVFCLPDTLPSSIDSQSARSKSATNSSKAMPQRVRAPRGKAKELILSLLQDGPKSREQIVVHFQENGLSVSSVSTLLNRLKNSGKIKCEDDTKQYHVVIV